MTTKASISLTDEQASFARSLVEQGRYASLSAVIQQGLELMRQQAEERELELEMMKKIIAERQNGPFISLEEFDQQIDEMLAEKQAKYGV